MRIGLLGCGQVARYGHIPAIVQTPGLDLVAFYDPVAERAKELAASIGGRGCEDLEDFWNVGLDVVAITSSAPAHYENVLDAARHGVHVICEKPIAMTEPEGAEMLEAMAGAGKGFFVGFCYRFSPVAQQLMRWIEEGIVGEIRSARLIYNWGAHGQWMRSDQGEWIRSRLFHGRMLEGGPLVDCGVHQIDLARMWLGEVESWTQAGAWVSDYAAPDHVWLHLLHEGGAMTTVEVSYTFGHTVREPLSLFTYELIGTGGVLRYDREGYVLEARTGKETLRVPGASEKNFPGMYSALASELAGGPKVMPTAEDGLIATRIARAATHALIAKR